jgi:hypothetical protein
MAFEQQYCGLVSSERIRYHMDWVNPRAVSF